MKIQLIDSRPGVVNTIILKEWMRIGLSICLLGLPVILGYLSLQIADARNAEFAKDSPTPTLGDEFDFSGQIPEVQDSALDSALNRVLGALDSAQKGQVAAARQFTRKPAVTIGGLIQNLQPPSRLAVITKSLPHRYWHRQREQQNTYHNGLAAVKHEGLALFAKYGDVLKKGQIIVLAALISYVPDPVFAIHKNGRVIDPASYIHSTIR